MRFEQLRTQSLKREMARRVIDILDVYGTRYWNLNRTASEKSFEFFSLPARSKDRERNRYNREFRITIIDKRR